MPSAAKPAPPAARTEQLKPYHHGDLRRVLIEAALQLAGENGVEAVSVARRRVAPGCSPGAPFGIFRAATP